MSTKIEWTDRVWNFLAGCSPVSEGCRNCYAARDAVRLAGNPNEKIATKYAGTAEMRGLGKARRAVFTGRVNVDEAALLKPLGVKKPQRWFVNSMADLFHPAVPFDVVDRAFAVMALCPQHTFQILTKRPERMAAYMGDWSQARRDGRGNAVLALGGITDGLPWPLPNVWLGTSVENQAAADERVPHLLDLPAAVRFLSCEPLLGPVDLEAVVRRHSRGGLAVGDVHHALRGEATDPASGPILSVPPLPRIDWVIVGGESGHGARPMHPEWARSLRDQCEAAGVAFFFKQWGEYTAATRPGTAPELSTLAPNQVVGWGDGKTNHTLFSRVGKPAAGRLLDGREHNDFPAPAEVAA